jgi:hypothetical protein
MTKPKSKRRPTYPKVRPGEWVQPIRRGYKCSCCDCGLVHRMNFRIRSGRVQFNAYRDNRATAAIRKAKVIKVREVKR